MPKLHAVFTTVNCISAIVPFAELRTSLSLQLPGTDIKDNCYVCILEPWHENFKSVASDYECKTGDESKELVMLFMALMLYIYIYIYRYKIEPGIIANQKVHCGFRQVRN